MLQSELAVQYDAHLLGTTIAEVANYGVYDEYIQSKDTPLPEKLINACAKDVLRLWNEAVIKRTYTETECLPHIITKNAQYKYFYASLKKPRMNFDISKRV